MHTNSQRQRQSEASYTAGVKSSGALASILSVSTIGGIAAQMSKMAPKRTNESEAMAMHLGFAIRLEAPIAPAVLPMAIPMVR